jgi:hypothetical protein
VRGNYLVPVPNSGQIDLAIPACELIEQNAELLRHTICKRLIQAFQRFSYCFGQSSNAARRPSTGGRSTINMATGLRDEKRHKVVNSCCSELFISFMEYIKFIPCAYAFIVAPYVEIFTTVRPVTAPSI